MEFFLIYAYFFITSITGWLIGLTVLSLIAGVIFLLVLGIEEPDLEDGTWKKIKLTIKRAVLFIVLPTILLTSAVPSKEEIAWIVGGGVTLNVAMSEEGRQIPDNVLSAANSFLESIDTREAETAEETTE